MVEEKWKNLKKIGKESQKVGVMERNKGRLLYEFKKSFLPYLPHHTHLFETQL